MRVLVLLPMLAGVSLADAGELIPYQLPPQVRSNSAPSVSASAPAPAASTVRIPESVYKQFEARVQGLKKPEERTALANDLSKSRATAAKNGDLVRELYYTRLLETLHKVQGESR